MDHVNSRLDWGQQTQGDGHPESITLLLLRQSATDIDHITLPHGWATLVYVNNLVPMTFGI